LVALASYLFLQSKRVIKMTKYQAFVISISLAILNPSTGNAQSQKFNDNSKALRPYLTPQKVTRLEWDLMQFNIMWIGSYSTPSSHLTSYPVLFDPKNYQFRTTFSVSEKRDYQDPEPWSSLPKLKKEAVLNGAAIQLRNLISNTFPEIKSQPSLLLINFQYQQKSGLLEVGRFENGELTVRE
jgi:hypothetical protein